jgi:RNA polymerase sigma factor (sigma-70 family)
LIPLRPPGKTSVRRCSTTRLAVNRTDDTKIGGPGDRFPVTRGSAIEAVRSAEGEERERAFDEIIAAYWKPVYKYVRIKWRKSNEDAKDLTQGFFAEAFAKRFFDSYDPRKARFRTFVRICLDGFVANEEKAAHRIKRGGNAVILSLDFENAEGELGRIPEPASVEMDDYFDREWTRSLLGLALEALRLKCEAEGKTTQFRMFARYYLDESEESSAGSPDSSKLSYQDLASEFEVTTTTVTNYLAFGRREFRKALLDKVRAVTATDEEFRREAKALLGEG